MTTIILTDTILQAAATAPGSAAATASGSWRPDVPFDGADGLKITMRREPGVTPAGLLEVPFRFHTGPIDTFSRPESYDWTTEKTVGAGEEAREGGPTLRRLNFGVMFLDLDEGHPWVVWRGSFDVQRLLDELRAILKAPAPFRLTISQEALWGPRPLTNMLAVLTTLTPEQRGGDIGTEYTGVEFLEITRRKLDQQSSRARPAASDLPRRYTLRAGDTLHHVALVSYKKASAWPSIAAANGITGVRPDSAAELAAWAKRHNRSTLRIPAQTKSPSSQLILNG